jgi:hypothetical protein
LSIGDLREKGCPKEKKTNQSVFVAMVEAKCPI